MRRLIKVFALLFIPGALGIIYLGSRAPSEPDVSNAKLATIESSSAVAAEPVAEAEYDNSAALLAEALRQIEVQEEPQWEKFLQKEGLVEVRDALREALNSPDILNRLSGDHSYWLTKRLGFVSWDLAIHGFTAEDFSGEEGAALLRDIFHNRSPEAFALASELVVVGNVVKVCNALDPRPERLEVQDHPPPLPAPAEFDGFRSTILVKVEEVLKASSDTALAPDDHVYIRQRSGLTRDGSPITVSTDFDSEGTGQYVFFLSNVMYRYAVHNPEHPVEPVDPAYEPRKDLYVERHSAHLLNPNDPESKKAIISGIREGITR